MMLSNDTNDSQSQRVSLENNSPGVDKIDNEDKNFKVEVVLFEPEIPQNTGNIARTCAALGCKLHLVGPLGFRLTDRYLKRAGIDYWHLVEVDRCPNLETFFETHTDGQYFFLSTKAKVSYDKANFKGKMYLVFGKESAGLPSFVFERYPNHIFRVPMRPGVRSLNLASTASLVMYEAFRQNGFYGVELTERPLSVIL